ncbi:kinase-like domain-containing protein [Syncephalis fuscata]|nr:kinase-like domain-containing protein [Syncephalis fuscata]
MSSSNNSTSYGNAEPSYHAASLASNDTPLKSLSHSSHVPDAVNTSVAGPSASPVPPALLYLLLLLQPMHHLNHLMTTTPMLWDSLPHVEMRDVAGWIEVFDLERTEILIRVGQTFIFGSGVECDYVIQEAVAPKQSFRIFMEGNLIMFHNISGVALTVNGKNAEDTKRIIFLNGGFISIPGCENHIVPDNSPDYKMAVGKKYTISKAILGSGTFGKVYVAEINATGERVAIKKSSNGLEKTQEEADLAVITFVSEIQILHELDNPFMVKMLDFMATAKFNYVVLEMAEGGDLKNYLKLHHPLPEPAAQYIVHQLMRGLKYLHKNNIIHRATFGNYIKPKNILLRGHHKYPHVMYSDFGLACQLEDAKHLQTITVVDAWSLGVTIYSLFSKKHPFEGFTDIHFLVRKMINDEPQFSGEVWKTVTDQAIGFIAALLNSSPSARYTAGMALKNSWLSEPFKTLVERYRDPQLLEELKDLEEDEETEQTELTKLKDSAQPIQDTDKEEPEEVAQKQATGTEDEPVQQEDDQNEEAKVEEEAEELVQNVQEAANLVEPFSSSKVEKRQLSHASENEAEESKRNKLDDDF